MNWCDPAERGALLSRVGVREYARQHAEHVKASTVEHVAGHSIRTVGTRFGRLFAVGFTGRAFATLAEAQSFARANPQEVGTTCPRCQGLGLGINVQFARRNNAFRCPACEGSGRQEVLDDYREEAKADAQSGRADDDEDWRTL